ncbi:MAG: hypothetical protein V3S41_01610 [Spirochaetia bacterium]
MKHNVLLSIFLVAGLAGVGAQESQFDLSPAPRFWGVSVFSRYSLEPPAANDVETSIIAGLSAAYETVGYYRTPNGSLFTDGDAGFTTDNTPYSRTDLWWQIGLQQGILPRTDLPEDQAVAFAYYRGRYDLPVRDDQQLYFSSGLPEVDGGLLGSVHAGLAYSNVTEGDATGAKRGVQAELVLGWGPSFLHNQILGSANFTRTTLSGRGFIPLYERTPDGERNWFSSYLAIFGAVDWATGPDVPMAVRSTIGTRSERPGTGGSVRGYESGRFDATLKAVGNVEIRANLPSIMLPGKLPVLIPGFLIYTDAGYYNDLDGFSPTAGDQSGTLLSSGAGVYLDIRGVAQFIFYTNYLWQPTRVDGTRWFPFSLGFGFHY